MGKIYLYIAGTKYPNDDGSDRETIISKCLEDDTLILKHTPVPQDKHGVSIFRQSGEQLGWIPRENARQIAHLLDSGKHIEAIFISTYRSYINAPLTAKIAVILPEVDVRRNKKLTIIGCGILLVFFILMVIILATCFGGKSKSPSNSSILEEPALELSAVQLYNEFYNNEIAADQKYKGQTLIVTGVVSSIAKDILGTPYVVLNNGGEFEIWGVQCLFPNTDAYKNSLATLNKGNTIKVKGECTGYLLNVMLEVK